ncbi:hypothetical protein RB653_008411 [Dictyostelium firmibasis]|uniref:Uncharacterized protein n=1 Tax=Dictyostelium firmibasis TaxID=79012 RepID=A0AAN7U018_9MYCE
MTILGSISSIGSMKMGGSKSLVKGSSYAASFGSNSSSSVISIFNPVLPVAAFISGTITSITGIVAGALTGAVDGLGKGANTGILLGYRPDNI